MYTKDRYNETGNKEMFTKDNNETGYKERSRLAKLNNVKNKVSISERPRHGSVAVIPNHRLSSVLENAYISTSVQCTSSLPPTPYHPPVTRHHPLTTAGQRGGAIASEASRLRRPHAMRGVVKLL